MSKRTLVRTVTLDGPPIRNKRRRVSRRIKMAVSRSVRSFNEHHFKRSVQGYWSMNQSTGFNGAGFDMQFSFSLQGQNNYVAGLFINTSGLPDYGEFTALYDQYRIDKIHMRFGFTNNQSGVNTAATELPVIKIVKDTDDVNTITGNQILQYAGMKSFQLGNGGVSKDGWYDFWVVPKPQVTTYRTAIGSGYSAPDKSIKIDTAYSDVPHYGVKLFWDPYGLTSNVSIGNMVILTTYYLTMTHTK